MDPSAWQSTTLKEGRATKKHGHDNSCTKAEEMGQVPSSEGGDEGTEAPHAGTTWNAAVGDQYEKLQRDAASYTPGPSEFSKTSMPEGGTRNEKVHPLKRFASSEAAHALTSLAVMPEEAANQARSDEPQQGAAAVMNEVVAAPATVQTEIRGGDDGSKADPAGRPADFRRLEAALTTLYGSLDLPTEGEQEASATTTQSLGPETVVQPDIGQGQAKHGVLVYGDAPVIGAGSGGSTLGGPTLGGDPSDESSTAVSTHPFATSALQVGPPAVGPVGQPAGYITERFPAGSGSHQATAPIDSEPPSSEDGYGRMPLTGASGLHAEHLVAKRPRVGGDHPPETMGCEAVDSVGRGREIGVGTEGYGTEYAEEQGGFTGGMAYRYDMFADDRDREHTRKAWLESEDQTIIDAVRELGVRWRQIAAKLPGRSDDAVRNRWNRLQESMREGSRSAVLGGGGMYDRPKTGYKCSRCGLPKRNHVCTYRPDPELPPDQQGLATARPNRREGRVATDSEKMRVSWAKREDDTIRACVEKVGPRWSLIANELPGRTEHAVRNRWHRLQNLAADAEVIAAGGGPRGEELAPDYATSLFFHQQQQSQQQAGGPVHRPLSAVPKARGRPHLPDADNDAAVVRQTAVEVAQRVGEEPPFMSEAEARSVAMQKQWMAHEKEQGPPPTHGSRTSRWNGQQAHDPTARVSTGSITPPMEATPLGPPTAPAAAPPISMSQAQAQHAMQLALQAHVPHAHAHAHAAAAAYAAVEAQAEAQAMEMYAARPPQRVEYPAAPSFVHPPPAHPSSFSYTYSHPQGTSFPMSNQSLVGMVTASQPPTPSSILMYAPMSNAPYP